MAGCCTEIEFSSDVLCALLQQFVADTGGIYDGPNIVAIEAGVCSVRQVSAPSIVDNGDGTFTFTDGAGAEVVVAVCDLLAAITPGTVSAGDSVVLIDELGSCKLAPAEASGMACLPTHAEGDWDLACPISEGGPTYCGPFGIVTEPDRYVRRSRFEFNAFPDLNSAAILAIGVNSARQDFSNTLEITNTTCYEAEVWAQLTTHMNMGFTKISAASMVLASSIRADINGVSQSDMHHCHLSTFFSQSATFPVAQQADTQTAGRMVRFGTLAPGASASMVLVRIVSNIGSTLPDNAGVLTVESELVVDLIPVTL